MAWVLTKSLARLRTDLNTAFPNRDHESDGSIGDAAHQRETSGHNPDDTLGSKAEYSDADTKAEVRAFDADDDLRDPNGIGMQNVVNSIMATADDRKRLMYIIYNRKIWRKRNGWKQEDYSGASAHTEHAHFSGDPLYDEDDSPWQGILAFAKHNIAGDDDMTPEEHQRLTNDDQMLFALTQLQNVANGVTVQGFSDAQGRMELPLVNLILGMNQKIDALTTGGVTQEMLNAAIVAALQNPAVLAALAPVLKAAAFAGAQQAEKE